MFLENSHLGFFALSWAHAGDQRQKCPAFDGDSTKLSQNPCQTSQWQVLEERDAATGNTTMQYVWSPVYVDAMISRDRDTDGNGSLDERLWVQQDANWNVTSVVDGNGAVQERYAYDAYGVRTVLDASWSVLGGSSVEWRQGFQGYMQDSVTTLYSANFRWYSATLGRWTSQDPKGFKAGDLDLYRMEKNDPINTVDPSGLEGGDEPNFYRDINNTPGLKIIAIPYADANYTEDGIKGLKAAGMLHPGRCMCPNYSSFHSDAKFDGWVIVRYYLKAGDTNSDLARKLLEQVKEKGQISILEVNGHGGPLGIVGFDVDSKEGGVRGHIPDFIKQAKDNKLFSESAKIYLSGCNTGIQGARAAKTLANELRIRTYGTTGESYGAIVLGSIRLKRNDEYPDSRGGWGGTGGYKEFYPELIKK